MLFKKLVSARELVLRKVIINTTVSKVSIMQRDLMPLSLFINFHISKIEHV